jgi:hypothetical protein
MHLNDVGQQPRFAAGVTIVSSLPPWGGRPVGAPGRPTEGAGFPKARPFFVSEAVEAALADQHPHGDDEQGDSENRAQHGIR